MTSIHQIQNHLNVCGPLNQFNYNAFFKNRRFFHNSSSLRFANSPQSETNKSDSEELKYSQSEYSSLYLIDNVRFYRLLGRLTKYSLLMFLVGSPACIVTSFLNLFPVDNLKLIFTCLSFYMLIFMTQSYVLTSRIVAKVMISSDRNMIKISHLSIFGDRNDLYLSTSDIVKFPYYGAEFMDKKYVIMKFKNRSKHLIFFPGQGSIDTNFEALEHLFCSDTKEN